MSELLKTQFSGPLENQTTTLSLVGENSFEMVVVPRETDVEDAISVSEMTRDSQTVADPSRRWSTRVKPQKLVDEKADSLPASNGWEAVATTALTLLAGGVLLAVSFWGLREVVDGLLQFDSMELVQTIRGSF